MNFEEARELSHKLNHGDAESGVGKATSIKTWKTRLTATDNPDGELLDVRVEQVDEAEFPLGHIGPARPADDDSNDAAHD